MHKFESEQFLPVTTEKAWEFFSNPKNLAVITPPEMEFKVLSDLKDENIYEGMEIAYRVKPLFGIPVKWITRIGNTEPGRTFVDHQVKGPYKKWEHKHSFIHEGPGVKMKDEVLYELPYGIIGSVIHRLIVRKRIEHIFEYRKQILKILFN